MRSLGNSRDPQPDLAASSPFPAQKRFSFSRVCITFAMTSSSMGDPMSSSLLALAILLAAADPGVPRKAFSTCLREFVTTSAEKKLPTDQFDSQISTACASQEQDFRKTVIASDVSRGISRKTSEQGVSDEIADYLTTAKENYRSALASN
jgi:hypothetical protein